jgi:YesN/AraC family two-component response regulator
LESVQGVVRDCQELMDSQELTQNQFTVLSNLQHHVLFSMINDYVYQNYELSMAVSRYEPYMDFYDTPYQIIYIYYLEEKELSKFLEQLKKRTVKELSKMTIHGTYTVNTLTLFFQKTHGKSELFKLEIEQILKELKEYVYRILENQSLRDSGRHTVSLITEQIFDYVEMHISDQDLTLKNICEQYLFLNRNYVCKKFQKDTGIKFSAYLTNIRIEKAKEYLSCSHPEPIQTIAELVGCGKNPQYFSQLFKRKTGISPSQYIAKNEQRDQ